MSYPVQVHPYHPRCQGKDHHGQECVDRSCLPLVNPGPLVCDGEVDQALAVEGAQDTQQGGLPQEPVESHAHARRGPTEIRKPKSRENMLRFTF